MKLTIPMRTALPGPAALAATTVASTASSSDAWRAQSKHARELQPSGRSR